jgi:hypothetical protein
VSARLRDAAGAGNCRAVGVTGAALQGVVVLLGQLESYAVVVGVDALMLPSRDLLDGAAISSGGGESLTAEIAVVQDAAFLLSRFREHFLSSSDRDMCISKVRRWRAHWLETPEPRLPPVRRLREADVKPCL